MTRAVDEQVLDTIRRVILEEADRLGVRVERIVLFGSRARGEASEESDWDLLIVVGDELNWRKRLELFSRIHRKLVNLLRTPVDILIIGTERFEERRKIPLTLEAEAEKGVSLPV